MVAVTTIVAVMITTGTMCESAIKIVLKQIEHKSEKSTFTSWDQLYKIWREGPFWTNFFWKWFSRRAKSDATKKKVLSLQEGGQKRKMVIKI